MTILGRGDLVPPRRYGRRRGRRRLLALLVIVAVGAAGYFGYRYLAGSDDEAVVKAAPTPCVTPSASASPADPRAVTVQVLNATRRVGLAHRVAVELRRRGFHVVGVGNSKVRVPQTRVDYPPDQQPAALAVTEQLLQPVSTQASVPRVVIRLGRDFRRLARGDEVAAARRQDVAAATPPSPACARR